jgi:hypothetical protein
VKRITKFKAKKQGADQLIERQENMGQNCDSDVVE